MDVLQELTDSPDTGGSPAPGFRNLPVDPEHLPVLETVDFKALSPAWLRWQLRRNLIFQVVVLVGLAIAIAINGWIIWFLIPLLVSLLVFGFVQTFIRKAYASRRYALRERDLTYQSGWIWWSETAVPFNRIQHCEIEQGPIEKLYGLATLEVYTAGKNSSDLSIGGLERGVAERLKDYILGRIQQETSEEE